MPNCIYFFPSFCVFEGWFELFKILISVVSVFAIFYGLNNWSKQLKGPHQISIIISLSRLLNLIKDKTEIIEVLIDGFSTPLIIDGKAIPFFENNDLKKTIDELNNYNNDLYKIILEEKNWIKNISRNLGQINILVESVIANIEWNYLSNDPFDANPDNQKQEKKLIPIIVKQILTYIDSVLNQVS
ncbi:MAG: hypothetical protein KKC20_25670 [Proteobacteria bacterium]|jgi:hypothetical protein|nr:hypothetical protein [Pseudomonadota bacterium]